jgi:hypothetical protein
VSEIPPSAGQLEAKAVYETWRKTNISLKDALLWLYDNGWCFQDEPEAWDNRTSHRQPFSNLHYLLRDLDTNIPDSQRRFVFEVVDTYISFKSTSMESPVLLREGRDEYQQNMWPNPVIKKAIGFQRRYDSINYEVVM